ncbi:MAG: OB-fold nucleic acid binding domain-containing protein, partial [Pirellulaceae bacterium]
ATFCSHTTVGLADIPHRAEVIMGGMISAIKIAHVRKLRPGAVATKYANFDLEDMHGAVRCIIWPDDYLKYGELVQPDAILLVRGAVDRRGGDEANLVVNELIPLDQLDSRYTSGVVIRIDQRVHAADVLPKVREIVRGYPGSRDLELVLSLDDGSRIHLRSQSMQLEINAELRRRVEELLGAGYYQLITSPPKPSNGNGNRGRRPPAGGRREA